MYAVLTRPDVAARFLHNPTQAHMKFARKILRYLYDTRDMKLTYQKSENPDDTETRRSRYGYLIFFGDALVCWKRPSMSVLHRHVKK